jgi:hypothetical protein
MSSFLTIFFCKVVLWKTFVNNLSGNLTSWKLHKFIKSTCFVGFFSIDPVLLIPTGSDPERPEPGNQEGRGTPKNESQGLAEQQQHRRQQQRQLLSGVVNTFGGRSSVANESAQKIKHDPRLQKSFTSESNTSVEVISIYRAFCRWKIKNAKMSLREIHPCVCIPKCSPMPVLNRFQAGWPDWAIFRPMEDILLWADLSKLQT